MALESDRTRPKTFTKSKTLCQLLNVSEPQFSNLKNGNDDPKTVTKIQWENMFNANCREGRGARKRFVPSLGVNYCSAFALWLLPLPSPQERWKEGPTQINSFNAHGSVVSRFYYTHLGIADLVLESTLADRAKSLHNTMLLPITYWTGVWLPNSV